MSAVGKWNGASIGAADDARAGKSRRLWVFDRKTSKKFLIDTGADVSVVPANAPDRRRKGNLVLFAANNSHIKTYGDRYLQLDLGLRRDFRWPFIVADVKCAIIGADLLSHYGLLPDLRNGKLLDSITSLSVNAIITQVESGSITSFEKESQFAQLLRDFPGITQPNARKPATFSSRVEHVIETTGPPVFAKARRLPAEKLAAAKLTFQEMLQTGEIRPSKSP